MGGGVDYYNFPRSTIKIKSFDEILTSEKIIFFAFFCCGGRSNLILGTGMENQIFILRTPAAIKFFHQILKNCYFGVELNSLSMQMDLYDPYKSPHTISQGNFIFQGVLIKFHILTKFPHLEKNCQFNERLKI